MDPKLWKRVTDLFEAAIDRPAGERAGFVDREADDPWTRAVVRALLAADVEPAQVLSITAEQLLLRRSPPSRDDPGGDA